MEDKIRAELARFGRDFPLHSALVLSPVLNSYERLQVHQLASAEFPHLSTVSLGVEPARSLVLTKVDEVTKVAEVTKVTDDGLEVMGGNVVNTGTERCGRKFVQLSFVSKSIGN